jgi:cytochrome c biogenesis protein CcmG/thiol:disulfide interchange protein DsbE
VRRIFLAPIIAIPLVALLWSGFGRDPSAIVSPLISKPAPKFTLTALDGKRVSLVSLRGHPVVLNFWASWCYDCTLEDPYLIAAWHRYRSEGVRFVGVSFQDNSANSATFMRKHGIGWLDLQDPGTRTAITYGVSGVPETFLIDPQGRIVLKSTGPVAPGSAVTPAELNRALQNLVGAPA